ncbi:MAG: hypothetical protein MUD17_12545, partial [Gemmatimonadaceae bacterium]|nr:hypothetical protein [Gemmatimonadaceae bacterium]
MRDEVVERGRSLARQRVVIVTRCEHQPHRLHLAAHFPRVSPVLRGPCAHIAAGGCARQRRIGARRGQQG